MPGAPPRLLDLDATVFLAFIEGVFRESDEQSATIDGYYAAALPKPKKTREERRAEIARFARMTSGDFA